MPKIYFMDTGLACYLTRWLSPETLMNSAVAGNMFETFVVSEILKSYSNEGRDYRFSIFYYRGKDKRSSGENEIDLVAADDASKTASFFEVKRAAHRYSPAALERKRDAFLRATGKFRGWRLSCGLLGLP